MLASGVFAVAGTLGTSGLRLWLAALLLLAIARPRMHRLDSRAWSGILLYGAAMAAMNVLLYSALERIPLGLAVTLEFLGPLAVASLGAKGPIDRFLPLLTLAGVAATAGVQSEVDEAGVLFGLGAAVAFGTYTLMAGRVGQDSAGVQGLALSVGVAALLLSPFSLPAVPKLESADWAAVLISALLGVALAYTLDFLATKLTSPRVVGTLFAVDPAAAAVVGALALNQKLSVSAAAGIGLVIASGAAIIWRSGRTATAPPGDVQP
ncbi:MULTISPECIES: EamA family transporter [Arthrobacter]|uniref:EamA family transporter n=1 Tax=Arthrobacter TaxID=1663 RepID=UPI001FE5EECB|nr:EamA family transporter [Arthrobacter citreus]